MPSSDESLDPHYKTKDIFSGGFFGTYYYIVILLQI